MVQGKTTPVWLRDALTYFDAWLPEMFMASREVGFSCAVVWQGQVVYEKAFGQANMQAQEPLTSKHRLRYASHSKTITAAVVMKLCEQGKLRLDEPLVSYLPWLKPNRHYATQTLREVLSHTTGTLRDGEESNFWDLERPFPTEKEMRTFFLQAKPVLEPGTQHKYSNYGYSLAELVIEAVTQQSCEDLTAELFFKPLRLKTLGYNPEIRDEFPFAVGYSDLIDNQRYPLEPRLDASRLRGVTGVYAKPADMAKLFYEIVAGKALLSQRSRNLMQAPLFNVEENWKGDGWYGLGLGITRVDGMKRYRHGGGYPGFITDTEVCHDLDIAISLGFNSLSGMPSTLARGMFEVLKFFRDERGVKNKFAKYEGRYWSLWGNGFVLLAAKDGLRVVTPMAMRPLAEVAKATWKNGKFKLSGISLNMAYNEPLQVEFANGKPTRCKYAGSWSVTDKKAFLKHLKQVGPRA